MRFITEGYVRSTQTRFIFYPAEAILYSLDHLLKDYIYTHVWLFSILLRWD